MCEQFMKIGYWLIEAVYTAAYKKDSPGVASSTQPNAS